MTKMLCAATCACLLLIAGSNSVQAQQPTETTTPTFERTPYGIGFQSAFPAYGISGMMDISEEMSIQAILGFLGTINTYAGRGLYRFSMTDMWNVYGYGMVGAWSHRYNSFEVVGLQMQRTRVTETVLGLGFGGGIEYDWRTWNPDLPPVVWNLEIGIGLVNFDHYNYNALLFGGGAHFRF